MSLSEIAQEFNDARAKASQLKIVLDCPKIFNYFLVVQKEDIYATNNSLNKDFCVAKKSNANLKLELDKLIDANVAVQLANNREMERLAGQQ